MGGNSRKWKLEETEASNCASYKLGLEREVSYLVCFVRSIEGKLDAVVG